MIGKIQNSVSFGALQMAENSTEKNLGNMMTKSIDDKKAIGAGLKEIDEASGDTLVIMDVKKSAATPGDGPRSGSPGGYDITLTNDKNEKLTRGFISIYAIPRQITEKMHELSEQLSKTLSDNTESVQDILSKYKKG